MNPLYYILENSGLTTWINPLNTQLNPICHLLALLAHHILHVSRIRVKRKTKQQWGGLWYLLSKVFCFSGRFLWSCYDKCPCSCMPFFLSKQLLVVKYLYSKPYFTTFIFILAIPYIHHATCFLKLPWLLTPLWEAKE